MIPTAALVWYKQDRDAAGTACFTPASSFVIRGDGPEKGILAARTPDFVYKQLADLH